MRRLLNRSSLPLIAVAVLLAGCSDQNQPVAPEIAQEIEAPFFSYEPEPGFDVLRRDEPLTQDHSVTKTIGWMGGVLDLPDAGVTLVIPPLALMSSTEITMTAPAGDAVAVEFAPHGLEFRFPAFIRVQPDGTEAEDAIEALAQGSNQEDGDDGVTLDSYRGVYYGESASGDGADPLEVLQTFLWDEYIVFAISHFSGYACASG